MFAMAASIKSGTGFTMLDTYLHDSGYGIHLGVKGVSGVANADIERCISANNSGGNLSSNTDGFCAEDMCPNLVLRDCVAYGVGDGCFDIKPDSPSWSGVWLTVATRALSSGVPMLRWLTLSPTIT